MSINKNLANPRSRIYSIGDISVMNHDPEDWKKPVVASLPLLWMWPYAGSDGTSKPAYHTVTYTE